MRFAIRHRVFVSSPLRRCAAAFVAAVLGTFLIAAPAIAQQAPAGDVPSVGVTPTESRASDPNRGQWFVFTIEPGKSGHTFARIGNPADVPQKITVYLRDLTFAKDGTPSIRKGAQEDIGAWGQVDQPDLVVPPHQFVQVGFTINVPQRAEPGDHVGVLVAESEPSAGAIKIIKQIATRVYVTVPGDATKAFRIEDITKKLGSGMFPSHADITVTLRNTGRVRLHPKIDIGGTKAAGPDPLLASSIETYAAKAHVPWYGGPVKIPVRVDADGITRDVSVSIFVVPWGPLSTVPVAVAAFFLLRALWRFRSRKLRRLQADLRRLEQLVAERPNGTEAVMAAMAASLPEDESAARARSARSALKRARRSKSTASLGRLALELHATGTPALPEILEALAGAAGDDRGALIAAASSYGSVALERAEAAGLSADVLAELRQALAPARPRRTKPVAAKSTS